MVIVFEIARPDRPAPFPAIGELRERFGRGNSRREAHGGTEFKRSLNVGSVDTAGKLDHQPLR